jgi:cytochrome c-type biogenesis protein CcmI
MTQLIGILSIITVLLLLVILYWPVLRDRSGDDFYRTGMTREKERSTREEFLHRRIADLDLDRDSGKLSPEEHEELVRPLREELASIQSDARTIAQKKSSGGIIRSSAVFFSLLVAAVTPLSLHAAPVTVEGRILNGTTGQLARVDQLELIKIDNGMQVVETLKEAGPNFRFKQVEQAGAPLLVRATHEGDSFISVIPPQESDGPQQKPIRTDITVYDRGARLEDMTFHSGLQVSKLRNGLNVTLVYAIDNKSKPGRSFDISDLTFPVPSDAKNLRVSVAHQSSGMPVNLEPEIVSGGIRLRRALRPGMSELSIQFNTETHVLKDRVDFTKNLLVNGRGDRPFFRVLIWRPADAIPEIKGGTARELDIPKLGKALQVVYDTDEVTFDFKAGGIWFDNPMDSDENPIFDHPYKSGIGLLFSLTILLLLLSILTGSKFRLTRDER